MMKHRQSPFHKRNQSGSVMIEALVSVLIFSMGIIALVGLQGSMIKNSSDAKYRSEASFVAQGLLANMWVDATNVINYAKTTEVPQLPNGTATVDVGPRRFATVTVRWQAPGMDPHQFVASAYIGDAY